MDASIIGFDIYAAYETPEEIVANALIYFSHTIKTNTSTFSLPCKENLRENH